MPETRAVALADYASGSTEPWSVEILCALVRGLRAQHIVELGAFEGRTTVWLAEAAASVGGRVTAVEYDAERAARVAARCQSHTNVTIVQQDALTFLAGQPPCTIDFAFVDDDHAFAHVAAELAALRPLMTLGGCIAVHDVLGRFGLAPLIYREGGLVLALPLLHSAGGLGLITFPPVELSMYDGSHVRAIRPR
jgi:predicted O-methyltransferase YrrM